MIVMKTIASATIQLNDSENTSLLADTIPTYWEQLLLLFVSHICGISDH